MSSQSPAQSLLEPPLSLAMSRAKSSSFSGESVSSLSDGHSLRRLSIEGGVGDSGVPSSPRHPAPLSPLSHSGREMVDASTQSDPDVVIGELTEQLEDMDQVQQQLLKLIEDARQVMRRLLSQYQAERQTNEVLMQKVDKEAFASAAEYNRFFVASMTTGNDANLSADSRTMIARLQTVLQISQQTAEDEEVVSQSRTQGESLNMFDWRL